jgi:hypothetical protein
MIVELTRVHPEKTVELHGEPPSIYRRSTIAGGQDESLAVIPSSWRVRIAADILPSTKDAQRAKAQLARVKR